MTRRVPAVRADPIDLGHGVSYQFFEWNGLNPAGLHKYHGGCSSAVMFDLPGVAEAFPKLPRWTVESLDPLTLSPSLLCRACGHHGFIRDGRWVPA